MKELFTTLFSEIGHKLALILLVGTTLITTGSAVTKLTTAPPKTEASDTAVQPSEIEAIETKPAESTNPIKPARLSPTPTVSRTPSPTPKLSGTTTVTTGSKVGLNTSISDDRDEKEDEDETREREDIENEDHYVQSAEKNEIQD